MKRIFIFTLTIIFALLLASCGGTAEPATTTSSTSDAYVSPSLDLNYENAINTRLQLTLGSLKLAETATPITAEQAATMLPLWQALQNMTKTGNSAQAEVNALLGQIESAFTPEQLTAIREMKLTSADMQTWASANGVSMGSGSGQPGSGQGGGGGMSPEERATKQAAEGVTAGSGGNGVSTAMLNALITYLQGLAQ